MDALHVEYQPARGRMRIVVKNAEGGVHGLLIQPNGGWRRILFTVGRGGRNWYAAHVLDVAAFSGVWTVKAADDAGTAVADVVVPGETEEPVRFRDFAADPVVVVEGEGTEITGRLEIERGGLWSPYARQPVSIRFRPKMGDWDEVDTVVTTRTGAFALRLDPGETGDVDAVFRASENTVVVAGHIGLAYISQAVIRVRYVGRPKTVHRQRGGKGEHFTCFRHTTRPDLSDSAARSGDVQVWYSTKKGGKRVKSPGINRQGTAQNPVTGSTTYVYGHNLTGKRYWAAIWKR